MIMIVVPLQIVTIGFTDPLHAKAFASIFAQVRGALSTSSRRAVVCTYGGAAHELPCVFVCV